MIGEALDDGCEWVRVCDANWDDPLDDTYGQRAGGRWNPPDSWRTLYLNEDRSTARANLVLFTAGWPFEPEDLRPDTGPHLAVVTLPRSQVVADVHTPAGIRAVGLPASYPVDAEGDVIGHDVTQSIGLRARDAGYRGVHCRSAQGTGRELAWFPATARSRARLVRRLSFDEWYWA